MSNSDRLQDSNILRRRLKPANVSEVNALMEPRLLNIGFGSTVVAERVVAIVSPNSAPMKRLKDEAKKDKRLIDATHGRRTRSIIIVDSNHIVLSAIQAETISQRFLTVKESG
jgi:regulator of extracellular matrix RemA (YlzA/DUF370 family)